MRSVMKLQNGIMPWSTPEEQGISSIDILSFMDDIQQRDIALHSFQIARHGKLIASVIASPYTSKSFHRIFSAAKGVVATAVLIAIQEDYIKMDDPVLPLIPRENLPEKIDDKWNRLTLYHLLTMHTGHAEDSFYAMYHSGRGEWVKQFFEQAPEYEPGTFFCYDMGAQYVMNELVKYTTGEDVGQFLKSRVFDYLDIEYQNNYTCDGAFFSSTIQFHPDALTKLSLLYLQKGRWEDRQIIREDLVELMEECHSPSFHMDDFNNVDPEDCAGYTLHMWRNSVGGYRFCGGQGQYGVIVPEYDMVFSSFAAEDRAVEIVKSFFTNVLRKSQLRPLPENAAAYQKLKERMDNFSLAPNGVSDHSALSEKINNRKYIFDNNDQDQKEISFSFLDDKVEIRTVSGKGTKLHYCGLNGAWLKSEGYILIDTPDGEVADLDRIFNYDPMITMLSGGWRDENSFEFYLRSDALLCDYRFLCEFSDRKLKIRCHSRSHAVRVSHMGQASLNEDTIYTATQE